MDIWKGRCRERACIVIDKLVGRKMERISKHFFAFILNYFSFFLWQVCDGVKDGEFPLRKASFWFFHEIKCSAFWGVGNLSQNLNLVNLKICRRCPKKIIPKISWRQEEMYYCTTYRNNVLSNSGFFWDISRRSLLKLRLFSVLNVRQDDSHHDLKWKRPACITVVQLCSSIIMYNYDFTTLVVALLLGSLHKRAKEKCGENYHL